MKNKDKYFPNNNQNSNRNWYVFARNFKLFAKNNPELIRPVHYALFFWIVELNNELRWPDKIFLPTRNAMSGIGTKDREMYYKILNDLEKWGFIKIIFRSSNQYTANQISLTLPEEDFIPLEPTNNY